MDIGDLLRPESSWADVLVRVAVNLGRPDEDFCYFADVHMPAALSIAARLQRSHALSHNRSSLTACRRRIEPAGNTLKCWSANR
ncbi:hypothetical protein [Mesorhizobium sp.]|uniref:hypothetical protein n=1 Tax=Mesorhizobium sp. TaxID=1871066 RepID=UPI00257CACE7|nr:hypothetical protein [Mesorhizobium sp.]